MSPLLGHIFYATAFGRYRTIDPASARLWFGGGAAICAIVFLPIALIRLRHVQDILNHGREVQGEVVGISFNRYFGRVLWRYEHQNQSLKAGTFLSRIAAEAKWMEIGHKVTVIVHEKQPQRSIIRDLYVKSTETGIP